VLFFGFTGAIVRVGAPALTGLWWYGTRCAQPSLRDIEANVVGIIRSACRPHCGQGVDSSDARTERRASKTRSQFSQ